MFWIPLPHIFKGPQTVDKAYPCFPLQIWPRFLSRCQPKSMINMRTEKPLECGNCTQEPSNPAQKPIDLGSSVSCGNITLLTFLTLRVVRGEFNHVTEAWHRIVIVLSDCSVDSVMLVEEGFNVVSLDLSDKMLKYALKERWNRRKEPNFDKWSELN